MKRCWCRFREINKNTFSNHFSNVSGWITITIYTSCKNKCLTSLSILFVYYSILNNKPKVLKVAKEGMMVIRQRKAERGKDLRDQKPERSETWEIRVLRDQSSERSEFLEIWKIRYMINLISEIRWVLISDRLTDRHFAIVESILRLKMKAYVILKKLKIFFWK